MRVSLLISGFSIENLDSAPFPLHFHEGMQLKNDEDTFLGSFISRNRIVVIVSMLFLILSMFSTLLLKILQGAGQGYKYGPGSGTFWWCIMSMFPWYQLQRISRTNQVPSTELCFRA